MNIRPDEDFAAASDEELVRIAKNGGSHVFDMLSERYASAIKIRAMRYSNTVGTDTEDFIQEGMLALFKAVLSFDFGQGVQFKTYAAVCINNSMASAIKKHLKTAKKAGVSIDVIDGERLVESSRAQGSAMPVEDIYIEREHSALLAVHLKSLLSNFERQVLRLYLRGHSYLQIAELLSTTTKAVDNALQRVRRKLKPEF